jgi:hypothetical protein
LSMFPPDPSFPSHQRRRAWSLRAERHLLMARCSPEGQPRHSLEDDRKRLMVSQHRKRISTSVRGKATPLRSEGIRTVRQGHPGREAGSQSQGSRRRENETARLPNVSRMSTPHTHDLGGGCCP